MPRLPLCVSGGGLGFPQPLCYMIMIYSLTQRASATTYSRRIESRGTRDESRRESGAAPSEYTRCGLRAVTDETGSCNDVTA